MAGSDTRRLLGQFNHLLESRGGGSADDGGLLQRFVAQRDQEAFAELVSRHGPLVLGVCRRVLGDHHDAEDVFQATFLVLARKAAAIHKPESLSCFLHGVAYRLAVKARAETDRRRRHEQRLPPPRESEEPDLSWREVRTLIDVELQRLPQTQRLPLVLCYLEGLTQDEAARRLGWPRGTLKRRLERGRERLRVRLIRRGVTLGTGLFAAALTESAARAAVPTTLRTVTVQTGMRFAAGEAGALAATRAALLAEGALQTVAMTRLKIVVILMVMLGCAAAAAGLASRRAPVENPPESRAEAPSPPKAGEARPVEPRPIRKDRDGDLLPEGAKARLGTRLLRHTDGISPVVFTRDGKTAIVGDRTGDIVYWDVATGREVRRLSRAVPNMPCNLAISGDGKMLAAADSVRELFLWDVATGKLLSRSRVPILDNRDSLINQVLFAPEGRTLALREGSQTILLWDAVHQKKLHQLKGHTGYVKCMAFSPDGKALASGAESDRHIRLWDVASGAEKRHIAGDGDIDRSLAFSPDGKTLAVIGSSSWQLAFFDPATGEKLRTARGTYVGLSALQYAPDGKTLAGIERGTVRILDAASGQRLRTFDAPPREMAGLTYSPDGRTIATFWSALPAVCPHTFDLWDAASGKLLHPSAGHRQGVTGLAFAADGQTVFSTAGDGGWDGVVLAWDTATGEVRGQFGEYGTGCYGLALSPDGKLLAACDSRGKLHVWDATTRKEVVKSDPNNPTICIYNSVAWAADGKTLVSGGYTDTTVRVWDAATGRQRRRIETKQGFPARVVLSPDGQTVAVGGYGDGTIHLWSIATGQERHKIATPPRPVPGESEGGRNGVIHSMVRSLAFHPDGSVLASTGECGEIDLWGPATGRHLRRWDTKAGYVNQLTFSPDGRTLVSGHSDWSVRLWEAATGQERACFRGHRAAVLAVAFSRDGRSIASGSEDTTILLWDATGGARPEAALTAEQLSALWTDLIGTDAGRAHRAIWRMALAPKQALPFLGDRLRRFAAEDAARQQQVERLLADLDDPAFAVREKAVGELEKMGPPIEPVLRKVLAGKPSLEVRRRVEKVLEKVTVWSGEWLRTLRALEAIEHMNTPDAERLLASLASGAPRSWLTEQARRSRARMERQHLQP